MDFKAMTEAALKRAGESLDDYEDTTLVFINETLFADSETVESAKALIEKAEGYGEYGCWYFTVINSRWAWINSITGGSMERADYNHHYNRGWRHSGTANASLDNCPQGAAGWAWEDGYLDNAAGRERYHLRECKNHDECG